MDTRHLVDPELLELLDAMPTVALSHEMLPLLREAERQTVLPIEVPSAVREAVVQTVRMIPGPPGAPEISLVIYAPRAAKALRPCIFHIHGGGFIGGLAELFEPLHRPLVHDLDCMLVSVNYRLAPEAPFPGAVEDCYAGLAWTIAHAASLGIDPQRIGVMGESAGGGLAAAVALLARDRGEHRLAFQHLIYPMLDDRTCISAEPNPVAGEFIWTAHNNRFGWTALLDREPGGEGVSLYAAPARATDLSGLPPAYIATASLDLFVDENIDYARRLMRAGVPTELHIYPGGFHGFDIAPSTARVAENARRDSRAALRRALWG